LGHEKWVGSCYWENLAVIDGDGQMHCEDVIRVYRKLINENVELAKTYRINRDDGIYRKTISIVYNMVFKILFPGLMSRDINSKPKVMSRAVYHFVLWNMAIALDEKRKF
jgi:hypothetical protein